jgi:hypothetical protein
MDRFAPIMLAAAGISDRTAGAEQVRNLKGEIILQAGCILGIGIALDRVHPFDQDGRSLAAELLDSHQRFGKLGCTLGVNQVPDLWEG